jgi:hypothetical protein
VTGNGAVHAGAITIATTAGIMRNDQYTGCYMVHNPTGTHWNSRRRILSCFVGGQMTVAGTSPLPVSSDWSIEYCGGHYTPIMAREIRLQSGASLFAQPCAVTMTGTPKYDALVANPTFGMTKFNISQPAPGSHDDWTGMYLIDHSGEPFLVGYGVDSTMCIAVMYDRTATLRAGQTFTVQAGYSADIQAGGSSLEWTYAGSRRSCLAGAAQAMGFDIDNLPLWSADEIGAGN